MFENIVVGVRDDQGGRDALALAQQLLGADGMLTLLHVQVVASRPAGESPSVQEAEARRQALASLTGLAGELSRTAEAACVEAPSPRRGLHEFASSRQADLLVVRSSTRDELARDFIGDDARDVLQDAPCAVAIAPAGYAQCPAALRRIGVAYDGSAESRRAVAVARRLAAETHAELSAFEAVTSARDDRDPWNIRAEFSEPVEAARQEIASLGGLKAQAGFGDAVEELASYGQSVDLLVIGAHRSRPLDRLLERSTGQELLDTASSPLLVLPSSQVHPG